MDVKAVLPYAMFLNKILSFFKAGCCHSFNLINAILRFFKTHRIDDSHITSI
jgi:hypothetical protein